MKAREFHTHSTRFLGNTGIELWAAAEQYGLQLGFYFESIDDLVELSRDDEDSFRSFISILEKMLTKKDNIISDKRIIYALAISLYNTHRSMRRRKIEESYMSTLYVSQDSARDIVSQYGPAMSNPIAFMADQSNVYNSILVGKGLGQPMIYVGNGKRNKPRPKGALASLHQFNLLEIESIDVMAYHPTIWYLLRDHKIEEYKHLFPKAIKLCEAWILNSTQRRQKMSAVSSSISTTKINTLQ